MGECDAIQGGGITQEVPGSLGKRVGEADKSLYYGFHGKDWARQGTQVSDWLVWIISAGSESRGLSLVAWSLALGD